MPWWYVLVMCVLKTCHLFCFGYEFMCLCSFYADGVYDVLNILSCGSLFLFYEVFLREFISLWVCYFCGSLFLPMCLKFSLRLDISNFCCSKPLMFLVMFFTCALFLLEDFFWSSVDEVFFFFLSRYFLCWIEGRYLYILLLTLVYY